jgi:hypothetical protein
MKSIKTNPNSAKGPDKGKIVNKLYCILLTTLELTWLYFFSKNQICQPERENNPQRVDKSDVSLHRGP